MRNCILCLIVFLSLAATADARGRRGGGGDSYGGESNSKLTAADCKDGLDVVNALREKNGWHPFKRNDKLYPFARDQALRQARSGRTGHHGCDLSDGCSAEGAGTAAAGGGDWSSCCWTENYAEAAASFCEVGSTRYCCIHVLSGQGGGGDSYGGGRGRRGRR